MEESKTAFIKELCLLCLLPEFQVVVNITQNNSWMLHGGKGRKRRNFQRGIEERHTKSFCRYKASNHLSCFFLSGRIKSS